MSLQDRAPLLDGLRRYAERGFAAFHTPGHRNGAGLEELAAVENLLALDLTELADLGGVSIPDRRSEAERLAADFFGADETFFLANGATEGILALLLSVGSPGDEILIARDCHLSVVHGLILSGLKPVFLAPRRVEGWTLPTLPPPEQLADAAQQHPRAKAVWLTNPSYAGVVGDLQPLAEIAHGFGLALFVDEAHGGYLRWTGSRLPEARDVADAWVHGAHKVMGSLTQTGLLHVRGERVDRNRLAAALAWVRSTSPSYLLLASLDALRRRLFRKGAADFQKMAEASSRLRRVLAEAGLDVLSSPGRGFYEIDPLKLVVSWLKQGLTGCDARRRLREEFRIQAEFSDRDQVGFFLSPVQSAEDMERLAVAAVALADGTLPPVERTAPPPFASGPAALTPRDAVFRPSEAVPLAAASGRVAGSAVAPYPPGIPLWVPGEAINEQAVLWLLEFLKAGGTAVNLEPGGKVRVLI